MSKNEKRHLEPKESHMRKQVGSLQKEIKTLLATRVCYSGTHVGPLVANRDGRVLTFVHKTSAKKGKNEGSEFLGQVVFGAGLKTATNEIYVENNKQRRLVMHDCADLKVIQKYLLMLRNGLRSLPVQPHKGNGCSKQKGHQSIIIQSSGGPEPKKSFEMAREIPSFETLDQLFHKAGIGLGKILCANRGKSGEIMILKFFADKNRERLLGRMIWTSQEGAEPDWSAWRATDQGGARNATKEEKWIMTEILTEVLESQGISVMA